MKREEYVMIVLSIISATSGVLGAFFTASIALGFNEKLKAYWNKTRRY